MPSGSLSSKNLQQVVFITGASAGIGAELARQAARRGAAVALLARRPERLSQVASEVRALGVPALELVADVTQAGELQAAAERTLAEFGQIDVLLANAGFGVRGAVEALSVADYQRQFDTNVFGVLRAIHAVLPALKASRGRLGVVGSLNGYLDVPEWSAYCMSKAALRSLCECMRHELSAHGVSVTHLVPGMVQSEFRQGNNFGVHDPQASDPVPAWLAMQTPRAASQMLDAVFAREAERVITWHAKALVTLERHAHWAVSLTMQRAGWLVERLSKK